MTDLGELASLLLNTHGCVVSGLRWICSRSSGRVRYQVGSRTALQKKSTRLDGKAEQWRGGKFLVEMMKGAGRIRARCIAARAKERPGALERWTVALESDRTLEIMESVVPAQGRRRIKRDRLIRVRRLRANKKRKTKVMI